MMNRRDFLKQSTGLVAGVGLASGSLSALAFDHAPRFKISLAEWSFHKALFGGQMDHLDFASVARKDFDISGAEYVNQFFKDKAKDVAYLDEMKKRADDNGVQSVLIMCDGEGNLGDPDQAKRIQAVENHYKWVDAASYLGCQHIRVNAFSDGTPEEQQKLVADGLSRLVDYGMKSGINIIVENHGGNSSNSEWLVGVMKLVGSPHVGTLPDFGNFNAYDWSKGDVPGNERREYDRYKGVAEMIPYAKDVSTKTHDFDAEGNESNIDYARMMKIVEDGGYRGWLGIEYEGEHLGEHEGIAKSKALLERVLGEKLAS